MNPNKSLAKEFVIKNLKDKESVEIETITNKAKEEEYLVLEKEDIEEAIEFLKESGDVFETSPGKIKLF